MAVNIVVQHEQLLEERLVEEPPDVFRCAVVCGLNICCVFQRSIKVGQRQVVFTVEAAYRLLGSGPLGPDTNLLLREQLLRDSVFIMRPEQLALLVLESIQLRGVLAQAHGR